MSNRCCPNCFSYPWLVEQVRDRSHKAGECDFCGSSDVALVLPHNLEPEFSNAIYQLYSVVEYGTNLGPGEDYIDVGTPPATLLQEDFDVFSQKLDNPEQTSLLADIMADQDNFDATTLYTRRRGWPFDDSSLAASWLQFCQKIKTDSKLTFEDDRLAGYFKARIHPIQAGDTLYRARSGYEQNGHGARPWAGHDIGAPPNAKRKAGRLNLGDQEILYCSDTEATALAEMRPWRGAKISMCQLKAIRDLTVIDLYTDVSWPNPFVDNDLRHALELSGIVFTLTRQLSLPLTMSDDEKTHYPPCQHLAGLIRSKYDGVIYGSAMSRGGKNFAFFDPSALEIFPSWLLEVQDIRIHFEEISSSAFCTIDEQWPGPLFKTKSSSFTPNATARR